MSRIPFRLSTIAFHFASDLCAECHPQRGKQAAKLTLALCALSMVNCRKSPLYSNCSLVTPDFAFQSLPRAITAVYIRPVGSHVLHPVLIA